MKNLTTVNILSILLLLVGAVSAQAQISYRVGYELATQTYRVYMTSSQSFTGINAQIATAQITLLLPHGTGANQFLVTNVQGKPVQKGTQTIQMFWDISSRANAPSEDPNTDFQSFGFSNSSGLQFNVLAGQEIELFSFQNTNPCSGPVRLINNTEPFAASIPNSTGTTAGNSLYIQGARNSNVYTVNYGNTASCSNQPCPKLVCVQFTIKRMH